MPHVTPLSDSAIFSISVVHPWFGDGDADREIDGDGDGLGLGLGTPQVTWTGTQLSVLAPLPSW